MMFRRIFKFFRFLISLLKTNMRLIYGMWKLAKFPQPAVTIFGGARVPKDSVYTKNAFTIAKELTKSGFSIITGGGPGIMEAANKGAYEVAKEHGLKKRRKKATSLGISLTSFKQESLNPYTDDTILMEHFFSRKWLLVRYSMGFVVFPGGFGTLDELFEILTLVQTYKMPKLPIILMEKEYWDPFIKWAKVALKKKLISEKDLDLVHLTDSVEEAVCIINDHCKGKRLKQPLYTK